MNAPQPRESPAFRRGEEVKADDQLSGAERDDHRDAYAYARPQARQAWLVRRRRKIREEIERNRRGEYTVPTWVLAVTLVAVVTAWVLVIVLA